MPCLFDVSEGSGTGTSIGMAPIAYFRVEVVLTSFLFTLLHQEMTLVDWINLNKRNAKILHCF